MKILYILLFFTNFQFSLPAENVLLTSIADDRAGRKGGKYGATQEKIHKIFLNNPNFGITHFQMWNWNDIEKTDFYKENKVLLDDLDVLKNSRAYKPYIIYKGLQSLEDGDFLIYTDTSPELWSAIEENYIIDSNVYDLSVLKELCKKNNDILTVHVKWDGDNHVPMGCPGRHTHAKFTLERCMKKMGLLKYRNSLQHASGMWVICKTEDTLKFIEEWLYWNLFEECSIVGRASVANDYSFAIEEGQSYDPVTLLELRPEAVSHRYDQSISGLLINRRGNKLVETPEDFWVTGLNPYNFLQYARKNVIYTFIDSNFSEKSN